MTLLRSQKFFLVSNLHPILNQTVYQTLVDLLASLIHIGWSKIDSYKYYTRIYTKPGFISLKYGCAWYPMKAGTHLRMFTTFAGLGYSII